MAYDRYDERRGWRDDRPRWSDDDRERGRQRSPEERGFFERAGEQIASWFGDDDDRGRDERGDWRARERGGDEREWRGGRDSWRSEDRDRPMSRGGEPGRGARDLWSDESSGGYRPMAGDYGRSGRFPGREDERPRGQWDRSDDRDEDRGRPSQSKWDRDEYRRTEFAGSTARSNHEDAHYHECRRRHIEDFDREYDEYRQQNRANFERDFGTWREQRQSKRQLLGQVREHMDVVGSDGGHVGTVDRVAGDRIILTKSDSDAGGAHHSLSCTDLGRIEGDKLMLDCTAEQAKQRWRDDSRERALFEREDQGSSGPHMLDRSFSGTYR